MMTSSIHTERIAHLLQELPPQSALLFEAPIDLFYLTGLDLSKGACLVSGEGATLFVDGRYQEEARASSPFPVASLSDPALFERARSSGALVVICDSGQTSFHRYETLSHLASSLDLTLDAKPALLQKLRAKKAAEELQAMRKAADLARRGLATALETLREGITEAEVVRTLLMFWLDEGGEGASFPPIVAFGANSARPHHHPGTTPLRKGDVILFDIGVQVDHYQSDFTRCFFYGTPPDPLPSCYELVKEAHLAAKELCHPNSTTHQLDRAARKKITEGGFGETFVHGLGHGIGLEVHEWPYLRHTGEETPLNEGYCITIEPGIYLEGVGGIRLEDTYLVTKEGCESLTNLPFEPLL